MCELVGFTSSDGRPSDLFKPHTLFSDAAIGFGIEGIAQGVAEGIEGLGDSLFVV